MKLCHDDVISTKSLDPFKYVPRVIQGGSPGAST